MCKDINEGIMKLLKEDGYKHISEAIGADFK
jgi:dihydroorotate dehydrogenase